MWRFKPNIEKMTRNRDVIGLVKALKNKDAVLRTGAAKALGEIGETRTVRTTHIYLVG